MRPLAAVVGLRRRVREVDSPGVDSDANPGMIRGPPADGYGLKRGGKKSSSRGVDSNTNPCMMGGSLGRFGGSGKRKGAEAGPEDL